MRRLATLAFSFAAGIFLAQYLLPYGWLLPAGAICAALGLGGLFWRAERRRRAMLIAWGLALGLVYNFWYTGFVQVPAEALADTDAEAVVMRLMDDPAESAYGASATVELRMEGLHGVRAKYYGSRSLLELAPGTVMTGGLHFKSAAHIRDDDVTGFTSKGILLLAYGGAETVVDTGNVESPRWWPVRVGRAVRERVAELFSGDTAGLTAAILTGEKAGLSEGAAADLTEAGIYHLTAVSGMHCGFLLLMLRAFLGERRRRLTAGVGIPVLLFYMLLAGGTPSVVRAGIMMICLLIAPLLGREGDPPTAMGLALALILLKNPFAAASISLQLSFAALTGILWLTPGLRRLLGGGRTREAVPKQLQGGSGGKRSGKLFDQLSGGVAVTLGAVALTAPLSAFYFNSLVLISPISNLLCLGAAGLLFFFGALSVAASFAWAPLGAALGLAVRALSWYLLTVSHLLARVPYHAVYFSNPYLKLWLAFAYLLFALAYLLKPAGRRKYWTAAGLAVLTLAVSVGLGRLRYGYRDLEAAVLDVGQGQSVILASGGQFLLADCGSSNRWYHPGEIAADQLLTMGCTRLNYLLLTHYDADHINGVTALMERLPVDTLLVPDYWDDAGLRERVLTAAEAHGAAVEFVREETVRPLGGSVLTIYPPLGERNDNDRGLALLCSAGDYDLLVTGDMGAGVERELSARYGLPDIEALVVGHHGSRGSTTEELLAALRPELAVVSVGANSYGHPAPQTLERLTEAGAEIYRTDLQGSVRISVESGPEAGR